MRKILLIVLSFMMAITIVQAQESTSSPRFTPSPPDYPKMPPGTPQATPPAFGSRSAYETELGWGILLFGFLITLLEVVVMLRLKKGWGTESIRVVGLTLVLTSGLFLIVTGYSQEQIAPMIGLLGTITGFLLGKTSADKSDVQH